MIETESGNLLTVTDPMENKTEVEYDALNRAVKMKCPEELKSGDRIS